MKLGDLIRHRRDGKMGLIVGERPMTIQWEVMWSDPGRGSAPTTYERQERLTSVLDILPRGIVRS